MPRAVFDLLGASASWKLAATTLSSRIIMTRFFIFCLSAGVACAGDGYLPLSPQSSAGEAACVERGSPVIAPSHRPPAFTAAVAFRLASAQRKTERNAVTVLKPARVFDGV